MFNLLSTVRDKYRFLFKQCKYEINCVYINGITCKTWLFCCWVHLYAAYVTTALPPELRMWAVALHILIYINEKYWDGVRHEMSISVFLLFVILMMLNVQWICILKEIKFNGFLKELTCFFCNFLRVSLCAWSLARHSLFKCHSDKYFWQIISLLNFSNTKLIYTLLKD